MIGIMDEFQLLGDTLCPLLREVRPALYCITGFDDTHYCTVGTVDPVTKVLRESIPRDLFKQGDSSVVFLNQVDANICSLCETFGGMQSGRTDMLGARIASKYEDTEAFLANLSTQGANNSLCGTKLHFVLDNLDVFATQLEGAAKLVRIQRAGMIAALSAFPEAKVVDSGKM